MKKNIIDIIVNNDDLIEHKSNHIIILNNKLKKEIVELTNTIQDKSIDAKELIKSAVREALDLKENDIIIIKQEHIFIKVFNDKTIRKVSPTEVNTIAGRYNGINENELNSFYDEFFSKDDCKFFFKIVVENLIDKCFIEEQIDNLMYEKNIFQYIQSTIVEELINEFDDSAEFLKGFSGYIFRIHFNDIFSQISEYMLNEISISNDYIIDFLKYYSLDIVIVNGVKYKVPELETGNGLKWNVISMLSIAKIYTRTRKAVKVSKQQISELDEKILEFFVNGISPIEYNNIFLKEKQKLTDQLRKENNKLERYLDSFKITKDDRRKDILNHDINKIKKEINIIRKKIEQLASKEVKSGVLEKFRKLDRAMDTLLRDLKGQEKILSQNEQSYKSIKKSLLKALISKKQRL